jgi:hypothetical protein
MKWLNCSKIRFVLFVFVAAIVPGGRIANADFTFGESVNLGPPINTPYGDYNVYISADSLELYVSSDRRPGGLCYFDMWRSTRENADNPWGPLVNVQEINSRYNEVFPCLSADGLTLYFSDWWDWNAAGNRPGGVGHHDLWMCTRLSTDDPWEPPVNMGVIINSLNAEVTPSVSQGGQVLIFASNRSGGLGNYDLWMSTRSAEESDWAAPVNMRLAVNSSAQDCEACLSTDGLVLFFSSDRPGGMGSYDMWMTTRRSQAVAWNPPVNLGQAINTSSIEGAPSLSPDLKTLYFVSNQPGGIGGYDMYEAPIIPILDFNGDGIVEIGDLLFLIESWGQDDSMTDIGPAPWGDGIVDVQDLEVLMSYWGQEIEDPTLAAHWKLDEAEGDIAFDSVGENNGTLYGEPLWQPDGGMIKGALQFDGINDYMSTPFVLNPASGKFRVFAWIKGGAPGQTIISQANGANWLSANPSEGYLMTELKVIGRSAATVASQTDITNGNWHRIGFLWDGSYRTLYVDDIEVARDMNVQSSLTGSNGCLHIGVGKNLEPGTFFSGLIDDVRVYNRAVTP